MKILKTYKWNDEHGIPCEVKALSKKEALNKFRAWIGEHVKRKDVY